MHLFFEGQIGFLDLRQVIQDNLDAIDHKPQPRPDQPQPCGRHQHCRKLCRERENLGLDHHDEQGRHAHAGGPAHRSEYLPCQLRRHTLRDPPCQQPDQSRHVNRQRDQHRQANEFPQRKINDRVFCQHIGQHGFKPTGPVTGVEPRNILHRVAREHPDRVAPFGLDPVQADGRGVVVHIKRPQQQRFARRARHRLVRGGCRIQRIGPVQQVVPVDHSFPADHGFKLSDQRCPHVLLAILLDIGQVKQMRGTDPIIAAHGPHKAFHRRTGCFAVDFWRDRGQTAVQCLDAIPAGGIAGFLFLLRPKRCRKDQKGGHQTREVS